MNQKKTRQGIDYQIHHDEVCILAVHTQESVLEIPAKMDGMPVKEIGKKALLSNKTIRELRLPDTVEVIGEWAFAHCSYLEKVWLFCKDIRFGKGAFKDCNRLQRIAFYGTEDRRIGALLAAVPVMLEAEYLLSLPEAGKEEWIQKLDARILTLLEKPDREGYSRQVLCGEEDLMASLDVYLDERRRQKARICYMRLFNDLHLEKRMKAYLEEWLLHHTKGCESQAAWEVVFKEHRSRQAYYQIFAQAGCITEENFDGLLADLGDDCAEMKAWLLRYKETSMQSKDFFEGLSLE